MRSPLDSLDDVTPMYRYKRRVPQPRLCVNGVCSVHARGDRPPAPLSFSDGDKADHLECSSDGLSVTYSGPGREEKDAASVRADVSIPTSGLGLYYFEITIADHGDTGRIGIGLCARNVRLEKMPGWESGSYAYHGDDGMLFLRTGASGTPYGPKYGTGDVIGCCWDLVDNTVFFTKNGKHLGTAFRSLSGTLYPTIGMQSMGGRVKANFGTDPFVFDIEAFAQQQREQVLSSIMNLTLTKDFRILSDTVLAYLMHNGYSRTAAAFAKDAGREDIFQGEHESMMKRQAVCEKVLGGDIDGAVADLEKQFPLVMKNQLSIRFLLHTQKFIEMIVSGSSPEETVEYGRRELSVFRNPEFVQAAEALDSAQGNPDSSLEYAEVLKDVYLLLAYGDPSKSPTGYLTKQSRREMVADRLNSAILASQGRPMRSILERFVCQSENVLKHLIKMGNGPAALVSVQDML